VADRRWIVPDWPAPLRVRSLITTRQGGVSAGPYDSLNLGGHVGDDWRAVTENRRRLRQSLPAAPCWLNQVHGSAVIDAGKTRTAVPTADAALARQPGIVCGVLTADCLPVLLCERSGHAVAAVHAGWRGLHAGVLESAVAALGVPGQQLLAYFGPAIGRTAFEVGDDVRAAFLAVNGEAAQAFKRLPVAPETGHAKEGIVTDAGFSCGGRRSGKWLADIYMLARQALARCGVSEFYGGEFCTLQDESRFFSFRRDGVTGRMASLIWLTDE